MSSVSTPAPTNSNDLTPGMFTRDGIVFCNSRQVAARFGKNNFDVNKAIRNLIKSGAPESNFASNEINDLTGTSIADYDLTRDGFTLLVMGFTGAEAMPFKLAYIARFNEMEEMIRSGTPDPAAFLNDPAAMRAALLGYTEKVIALEADKAALTPKAAALEQLASKEGLFGFRVAAYLVGWTQNKFIDRVHEVGWTHTPKDWQIHAHIAKAGYMKYRSVERHHRDGEAFVKHQPMFTTRGLTKIMELIGEMPGDEGKKVLSLCNSIDDMNSVLEEGWTKEGNDWFIDNPGPKRALQLIKRLVKTLPSTKAETAARNRILKEFTVDQPVWFIAKILWSNHIRQEIRDKFATVTVPLAKTLEPAS